MSVEEYPTESHTQAAAAFAEVGHHKRMSWSNAQNGENIIIIHSGWGDGNYLVVGSFDANHQLLTVHIDFFDI